MQGFSQKDYMPSASSGYSQRGYNPRGRPGNASYASNANPYNNLNGYTRGGKKYRKTKSRKYKGGSSGMRGGKTRRNRRKK